MIHEILSSPIAFARAWWLRSVFQASRLTVYQGLIGMLRSPSGAPTYASQFKMWRDRARSRSQSIAPAHAVIVSRLEQGLGLAAALRPFIPQDEYMMVMAGETSGRLLQSFESVIQSAQAQQTMRKGVREAYREATSSLVTFLVLTFVSGIMVWPTLLQSIPEKFWDSWALPMIAGQVTLTQNPWLLLLGVVIYGGYRWTLPRWTGPTRRIAEKLLAPYGAYRDQQAATLLIVLAGLLRAKLTLHQALDRLSGQGNPYMRSHTRMIARREIQFAGDTARTLDSGIFSDALLDQIDNAAASRDQAETIQYMGSEAMQEVVETVKASARTGGNVLMAVTSLLIAYYAAVMAIGSQTASDRLMQATQTGQATAQSR